METNLISLAVRKLQIHTARRLPHTATEPRSNQLRISVIATSPEATRAALQRAGEMASSLEARIALIVLQVVPFPCSLADPPVLKEFNEDRYRVIVAESTIPASVRILLCRDRVETLCSSLEPESLVVLGGKKHWWPTPEQRLARKLRHSGHRVILIETE